jgi:hypothetical protein
MRIFDSSTTTPFVFSLTEAAKDYLLREGMDMKYGARHLKRAIDRSLVHSMSNLMATGQVRRGDFVTVGFDSGANDLTFIREAENMPASAMLHMMKESADLPLRFVSVGALGQIPGKAARGRR